MKHSFKNKKQGDFLIEYLLIFGGVAVFMFFGILMFLSSDPSLNHETERQSSAEATPEITTRNNVELTFQRLGSNVYFLPRANDTHPDSIFRRKLEAFLETNKYMRVIHIEEQRNGYIILTEMNY